MSKPKKAPRKKAGYTMPDPLPPGEILIDNGKKKWKLGPPIGKGGFGEIYSACEEGSKTSKYVIKIEPHENGPLFVEMHFYMRNAKQADVEEFCKKKKLSHFGMPLYIGSGSHEFNGKKYRFLVMEKFGSDIWKLFLENNRKFPAATAYQIALQIVDVLEYIHEKGYVHADIKGANILMSASSKSQVYLVDFGLATHFNTDATFKPNPKRAHNGTIEYLSRDAHLGVETRRGDLEILAYNLIDWLGGKLPWISNLTDPKIVQQSKEEHMSNIKKFLKSSFTEPPTTIETLLKYVNSLKFNDTPDYRKVHTILLAGLKEAGGTLGKPLLFSTKKTPEKRNGTAISEATPPKQAKKGRKKLLEPVEEEKQEEKCNSSTEENKTPPPAEATTKKVKNGKKETKKQANVVESNGYEGYTPAMLEILEKKQKRIKVVKAPKEAVASTSGGDAGRKRALRLQQPVVYFNSDDDGTPVKGTRKRKK